MFLSFAFFVFKRQQRLDIKWRIGVFWSFLHNGSSNDDHQNFDAQKHQTQFKVALSDDLPCNRVIDEQDCPQHLDKENRKGNDCEIVMQAFQKCTIIRGKIHFLKHFIPDTVYFFYLGILNQNCHMLYVFDQSPDHKNEE